MMLISPEKKYKDDLFSLWKTCFGDEDGYIDLFFNKEYDHCKTFARFENETIVSALYLLDCFITLDGKRYDGAYLYAAATRPENRKQGHMAALIKEAQQFVKKESKAFIALVPGEEWLYSYYRKFGFQKEMYKYRTETESGSSVSRKEIDCEDYLSFRLSSLRNALQFEKAEFSYVSDCYGCSGIGFRNDGGNFMISDGRTVFEFLGSREFSGEEKEVFSMSPVSDQSEKLVFGQLYFTSEKTAKIFENAEIYMNNALD